MTADRVERRLTVVLVAGVEAAPNSHPGALAGRPASRPLKVKRRVSMWIAATLVLLVSNGEIAAQSNTNGTAAQPKKILLLN